MLLYFGVVAVVLVLCGPVVVDELVLVSLMVHHDVVVGIERFLLLVVVRE